MRGHHEAQHRPGGHRRPRTPAGDRRASCRSAARTPARSTRERREREQQVQEHLRARLPVVALKNSVSASETVTNTSPATPIAYASASRANGGNVVDSSLGRAFVITTYPCRAAGLIACPVPGLVGHPSGIVARLPFGHAPGRRQSRGRLAPLPRPRALVARVQRPGAGARRERLTCRCSSGRSSSRSSAPTSTSSSRCASRA